MEEALLGAPLGLCKDVKLVSKKRRRGGGVGLGCSRRPYSSSDLEPLLFEEHRCGFLGPSVVITCGVKDVFLSNCV